MTSKEALEELKQIWSKEEWCKGIPLSADSLKSLFDYNEELFNKNLELDKENLILKQSVKDTYDFSQEIIAELKEALDTFKLAFYTLWKCCNSDNIPSDIDSDFYLEFKCGYESLCFPITEQEIESIEKATELLDINVKEVLENEKQ